jgi:hypothetical protein
MSDVLVNDVTQVQSNVAAANSNAQVANNTIQTANNVGYTNVAQSTQAVFTQEQLNSIISGRINPLNQSISDLKTQLADSQKLNASYLNELNGFKNRDSAVKAGVPSQFVDFAVFEANKLAVGGKTFDDAIKEYVASNASLFGVSNAGSQVTTPTSPAGANTTQSVAGSTQAASQLQGFNNFNAQVQNSTSNVSNQTTGVVYGATNQSGQTPNNIANGNCIQSSDVDAFLKARGLKK